MRTTRRFVIFLAAIALACTAGPWLLENLGFRFLGLQEGGVGDMFAGHVLRGDIVRIDVILLVQGLLILALILGFPHLHDDRVTLILGVAMTLAAALASVQIVPVPIGGCTASELAARIAATTARTQSAAAALLLVSVYLIRRRRHLPLTAWLTMLVLAAVGLGALEVGVLRDSGLTASQVTVVRVGLLGAYAAVGLLLGLEIRRSRAFAFGLATVAGLLPLAAGQVYQLAVSGPAAGSPSIPGLMVWFGHLMPIFGLSVDMARRASNEAQHQRLTMQHTISRALTVLLRSDRDDFSAAMHEALAIVARSCRADYAFVYRNDPRAGVIERVYSWRGGQTVGEPTFPMTGLEPLLVALRAGQAIRLTSVEMIPPQCQELRAIMATNGAGTALIVPIVHDGQLWGNMGVASTKSAWPWRDSDEALLRALADIFSGAHGRHVAEQQLVAATEVATSSNRAKSEFLANMSHEIRTPLNAVIGLADLLQELDPTPQQRQYLTMVNSAAVSLLGVINDVLDFSKIEAGELVLDTITVDLPSLLEEIVTLMQYPAEQHGLDFVFDLAADVPRQVVADPVRLRQVLTNLIANAIKFTENGSVELCVSRLAADLDHPERVRFVVADTGIGIPSHKLPLIFEKFTQADNSHTRRFGGTGLGLAISRRLVAFMDGKIEVESEVGRGTRFTVDIPLITAHASEAAIVPDAVTSARRLVVIGRHERSRAVLEAALAALGARVVATGEVNEVNGLLPTADAVFLDGERDGPLARALERAWGDLAPAQRPAVIRLAPLGDVQAAREPRDDGAHLLPRPATPARLRQALHQVFAPAVAAAPAAVAVPVAPDRPAMRVLLVEDNLFNQKVASSLLVTLGCEVEVASNGKQAVAAVAAQPFDLVLMDCQMPEMDGLEATRCIRGLPGDASRVAVVAMTANTLPEHRDECISAGMDDFATKPINRKALAALIERWSPTAVNV